MSVGVFTLFNSCRTGLGDGAINLNSDSLKCGFASASYTPADSHSLWSQVSTFEISSSGYTAGGIDLANTAYTATGSAKAKLTCDDFTVSGTGTKKVKWGVVYDISSTPANRLVGYWNMDDAASTGVEATTIIVAFPNNTIFQAS